MSYAMILTILSNLQLIVTFVSNAMFKIAHSANLTKNTSVINVKPNIYWMIINSVLRIYQTKQIILK